MVVAALRLIGVTLAGSTAIEWTDTAPIPALGTRAAGERTFCPIGPLCVDSVDCMNRGIGPNVIMGLV